MVAPRKRTPQMFMGAPTAPQATNPAGMFGAPLTRQEPKRSFDWASLLQGIGAGLLTGDNIGDGLGKGLILAREFGDQRADNERYDRRDQREEERYQYGLNQDQQATQAAAAEKAQRDAAIDALPIDPAMKQALKANVADYNDVVPKAKDPSLTTFYEGDQQYQGYLGPDGKPVRVTENSPRWQPNQGPQDPERVRLAKAAGLTPGTPAYQQFLLGKDDTPTGPFQGTGIDAQSYNIVLTGDPSTPEYAAAYAQLGQPKTSMDPNTNQIVSIQPDLSWARKPTGQATPPANPNLSTTQVPGATVTSQAPDTTALTPEQRNKFKQQTLALDNLESALTEYEAALDKYGSMETYGEGKGVLTSAYSNVLIQAKEAANLGALTGPDMDIMNQTVIAPNSLDQATVGGAPGVKTQLGSVRNQLKQKRENLNKLYGPQAPSNETPKKRVKVDAQGNLIN